MYKTAVDQESEQTSTSALAHSGQPGQQRLPVYWGSTQGRTKDGAHVRVRCYLLVVTDGIVRGMGTTCKFNCVPQKIG